MYRKTNSYLRWLTKILGDVPMVLLTSFFSDTARLYDVLGVQPGVDHYLNLGWWTDKLRDAKPVDERIITEACREMVRKLASFGNVEPDHRVLDVGFGFAQQDVLLAREFGCRDIIGIELSPYHVKKGRKLIESNEVDDAVSLHLGDAVNLPYPSNHFEKVFALETAFHFQTRQDFFEEAHRVLEPGGHLLTSDLIDGSKRGSDDSLASSVMTRVHEGYWNVPPENRIDQREYEMSLQNKGFTTVDVRNVSEKSLEPWVQNYLRWRLERKAKPFQWLGGPILEKIINFYQKGYFNYVIARAQA